MTHNGVRIGAVKMKDSGCRVLLPREFIHKQNPVNVQTFDKRALNIRRVINHLIKYEQEIESLVLVVNWDNGVSNVQHTGVTPSECALAQNLIGIAFGNLCNELEED